jgi:hypothetical protein
MNSNINGHQEKASESRAFTASKFTDRRETALSFLMREPIKAGITEIGLGFLLVAALIGFAILGWVGMGYICDALFSTLPAGISQI